MNMRGLVCGLMLSLAFSLLASTTTSAEGTEVLWPSNGTYTIEQSQTVSYDATKLCTQQTIKTVYLLNSPVSERSACVGETSYGSVATGSFLNRFVGDYVQLTVNAIPVPNTSKMYVLECGYPCRLVTYDTKQGFNVSTSNYGYRLTPKAAAVPVMHPTINENISVVSIGYSPNGRWLAIQANDGFYRYDTGTGQFIKFSDPRGSYGVGRDPSFVYSITEDGRYIALSGSNYGDAFVFDLEACSSRSTGSPVRLLGATCDAIELRRLINANGYYASGLYGVAFRSGGKQIIAYGPDSSNKAKGYIGRLKGFASRADYVALGDSFSSGEGDIRDNTRYMPGTDGTVEYPKEKCHISARSYPFLLQNESAMRSFVKSFACSGAETNQVIEAAAKYVGQFKQIEGVGNFDIISTFQSNAYNSDIAGRIPQYRFIEKYQPKNITITIGGNDAGFGNVLQACIWSGTCEFESLERGAKALEMQSKFQVLRDTYRKIKNASPESKLYVLSYPQFIDDSNQCNPNVGLNQAERTFVRNSISYFNQVIRHAALAEGATFIDIEESLRGEALCSSKLFDLAVNGIVDGDDIYSIIGQESFHPNSRGHEMIANYIKENYGAFPELSGETCPDTTCKDYRAPAVPSYFNVLPTTVQRYKFALINEVKNVFKRGSEIKLSLPNFIPNGVGRVSIHSTPRDLGPVIADANGVYQATITLPQDIDPGYHEVHLKTTGFDGKNVSYYQPITIIASDDDVDGDGLVNEEDVCGFNELAAIDVDQDGIDDGCDGIIVSKPIENIVVDSDDTPLRSPVESSAPTQAPVSASTITGSSNNSVEIANRSNTQENEEVFTSEIRNNEQVAGTSDSIRNDSVQQIAAVNNPAKKSFSWMGIAATIVVIIGANLCIRHYRSVAI